MNQANFLKWVAFSIIGFVLFFTACQKDRYAIEKDESKNLSSAAPAKTMRASSKVATDWYQLQTRIMLYANPNPSPVVTGRIFAYQGIALYEAVRHGIPNSVALNSLLYQMPELPAKEANNGYSWPIAANAVLAYMTRNMFGGLTPANIASIDSLEAAYNQSLQPSTASTVFQRSQDFGRSVAAAIFEWAKTDGVSRNADPYTPPVFDGAWIPTPPLYAPAALPYLGEYRPLLADHLNGVIAPFSKPYSEIEGSPFYNEMHATYLAAKNATDEQRAMSIHWADVGVGTGYSTPGHHIKILTSVLEDKGADLGTAAMAYAKTGIALRDAFILTWRSKYTYNQIRPVTYVQELIDATWLPNLGTPNHPEYPAAHAVITSAFMQTMTGLFGENYAFTDNAYTILGRSPRHYDSFNDAATEAGWSRYYAGLHLPSSVEAGLAYGRQIGMHVSALELQK